MRSARSPKPMPPEAEARWSRYKLAVRMAGMSDAELARTLRLKHRQQLSQVVTGQAAGIALWPRVAKALKVDPAWLLTGAGDAPKWSAGADASAVIAMLNAASAMLKGMPKGGDAKAALAAIEAAKVAVGKL